MQIFRFTGRDDRVYTGCDYDKGLASVIEGDVFKTFVNTGRQVAVKKFLPPLLPSAIICIGLNYRRHAEETGAQLPQYPVVFMKNPGAVVGHGQDILLPRSCVNPPEVDYEAELAVVIGRAVRNAGPDEALASVFAYTCANDVSARRWQKHAGAGQWVRGKSFDTFCPLGPWMVTADEIDDPQDLDIQSVLNGQVMQKSNTGDMIFSVAKIIAYLSESTTLLPGTVILTGTPEGVGFVRKPPVYLQQGDEIVVEIERIGQLATNVRNEGG